MRQDIGKDIYNLALEVIASHKDNGVHLEVNSEKQYEDLIKTLCKIAVDFSYDCRVNKYVFKKMKDKIDELEITIEK
jgi:methyl coenzyme M reductase subunit D